MLHGDRVFVSNVNLIKRHTKPNPQANQAGGIVEREASIHLSNVQLFNPATNKGERVGTKTLEDGRKVRVFRSIWRGRGRVRNTIMTRLEKFYKDQVVAKLTEQFGYQNVMQVPRITKITLNMGVGEAAGNKKVLENAVADMAKIAGPEADHDQGARFRRLVQDPRRLADRLQGDLAPRADVGIPRSSDQHLAAARARLPWCVGARLSTVVATTTSV